MLFQTIASTPLRWRPDPMTLERESLSGLPNLHHGFFCSPKLAPLSPTEKSFACKFAAKSRGVYRTSMVDAARHRDDRMVREVIGFR